MHMFASLGDLPERNGISTFVLHFRCLAPQNNNTSVPSMFQGLLKVNIEGIWPLADNT